MRYLLAGKLISQIPGSFLQRLELLEPSLAEIQTTWGRLLDRLVLGRSELDALSSLETVKLYKHLRSAEFHDYELALERQGQAWARANVPEEYAIAALGFLYEASLPYLLGDASSDKKQILTLAQLIYAGQVCLVSGYANHRAASQWTLEEKLRRADQHIQALGLHVTEAYEQERRRLSRDLHDEVGHDLAVLKLYLEMLTVDVQNKKVSDVSRKLEEAVNLISKAIEAVRRLSFDMGPGISDELGFAPAIKFYARRFAMRTGIKVRVRVTPASLEPPSRIKIALYRVLQGALSNVLRHSRAKEVKITLKSVDGAVSMSAEDDGVGFNVLRKLRDPKKTFGLLAMRERIGLLEGSLQVVSPVRRSGKKRRGARIEVFLPVPEQEMR